MRTRVLILVIVILTSLALLAPAANAAPYCGQRWGSLPEQVDRNVTVAEMVNVRAGRHACFDRLVFDFRNAPAPGWRIEYVDQVRADGSGHVVPLRGGARLQVTLRPAATHDVRGRALYTKRGPSVAGFRTLREVRNAGTFEAQTTFGVGVRARLPFRAFLLPGPGGGSRVVLDVAHRW